MENIVKSTAVPPVKFPYATGYIDRGTGVKFIGYHPALFAKQWQLYLEGLERSYEARGVDGILERESLESGEGVSLFLLGYTKDGECVAGIRFHGPLASVDETSLITEMASSPEIDLIRDTVNEACTQGAIEIKGLWSLGKGVVGTSLLVSMTRAVLVAQEWLGVENAFGTVAERMTSLQEQAGAFVVGEHSVAFPDDRYRTILGWYRRSLSPLISPREYTKELEDDLQQLASGQVT
jgi:hypothetical protein